MAQDRSGLLTIAVIPDPVRYSCNLYLTLLYNGIGSRITGARSVAAHGSNKADVLHIHFPDHVLSISLGVKLAFSRGALLFGTLLLARVRHIPIVWTVHNIRPHHCKSNTARGILYKMLGTFVSGLIFHSEAMRRELLRYYPFFSARCYDIIRHPAYPAFPPTFREESPIRSLVISDNQRIVCIVGAIRANKNLLQVLRHFVQIKNGEWILFIAGEPLEAQIADAIMELSDGCPNVHYIPCFLSEGEFDEILLASDVVAIPYGEFHTSGVAVRALSRQRKVLALESPEMNEIQSLVPSMVRVVASLDQFWSALPHRHEAGWGGSNVAELPDEFSPAYCQDRLLRFYRRFEASCQRN